MSKFVDFVVGGLELAGGLALGPLGFGLIGAGLAVLLAAGGVGFILSGIGTLLAGNNQPGLAWAARNPIKAWDVIYGRACAGGTITYVGGHQECL